MALRTGCSKAVATLTATRVAAVPAASRFGAYPTQLATRLRLRRLGTFALRTRASLQRGRSHTTRVLLGTLQSVVLLRVASRRRPGCHPGKPCRGLRPPRSAAMCAVARASCWKDRGASPYFAPPPAFCRRSQRFTTCSLPWADGCGLGGLVCAWRTVNGNPQPSSPRYGIGKSASARKTSPPPGATPTLDDTLRHQSQRAHPF